MNLTNITVEATRRDVFPVDDVTRAVRGVHDRNYKHSSSAESTIALRAVASGSVLCDALVEIFREDTLAADLDAHPVDMSPVLRDVLDEDDRLSSGLTAGEGPGVVALLSRVTLHPGAAFQRADDVLFRNVASVVATLTNERVAAVLYDPRRDENQTPDADPRVTAIRVGYEPVGEGATTMFLPPREMDAEPVPRPEC